METYEQQIHDLQGKLEYQSNKIWSSDIIYN